MPCWIAINIAQALLFWTRWQWWLFEIAEFTYGLSNYNYNPGEKQGYVLVNTISDFIRERSPFHSSFQGA